MRTRSRSAFFVAAGWFAFFAALGPQPIAVHAADTTPKISPPKIYDESADGSKQIADALAIATKENKHVLVQVGANWCGWCHKLHRLFNSDKDIAATLKAGFVVVMLDVNQGHNKDLNAKFGTDQFGLPALAVLDASGKVIKTQETDALEEGKHHDPQKVLSFLKEWAPKK